MEFNFYNNAGELKITNNSLAVPQSLNDLNDVIITGPTSGDVLTYSGTEWIESSPGAVASAGDFKMAISAAASSGWLRCDGATVSQTTYADLWTSMGSSHIFGADPGGGNFLLPDFRGRMPVGVGTNGDVNAVGDSDAIAEASRTPNSTSDDPGSHTHTIAHTHSMSHTHGMTNNGSVHTHSVNGNTNNGTTSTNTPTGSGSTRPTVSHAHAVNIQSGNANVQHAHTTNSMSTSTTGASSAANSGGDGAHTHVVSNPFLAVHFDVYTGV